MNGTCPDQVQWREWLGGSLDEAKRAQRAVHLEGCVPCQQLLEELTSGDEAWAAAARDATPAPDEPALARAINELKDCKPEGGVAGMDFPAKIDDYEILGEVGRGGMGVVLKGFDTKLHRVVAIKRLAPHLAANAAARERFLREARAAASVAHEHVVTIHAVEEASDGAPYIVMQFVAGRSLQDRLDQDGRLELKEILRIGMQAAAGLAAAHAQGIVHRDVKPANILLENGVERVRLADFGLARAVDDANLTASGVLTGSPMFMSPEQASAEAVDQRSDLFSLGAVLYTMAAGHPPFRASTALAVLKRVCEENPRPLRQVNSDIPDWFESVVFKLMEKRPADRFASAAEVADLLGQHLRCLQHPDAPKPIIAGTVGTPRPDAGRGEDRPIPRPQPARNSGAGLPAESAALRKHNSPSQNHPEGEPDRRPGDFKRAAVGVGQLLTGGPESYRLAYLSLLILGAAWLFIPSGRLDEVWQRPAIATLISFILSRGALSLFGAERLTWGQKWLLYPALAVVYIPLTAVVLLGPVAVAGLIASKTIDQFNHERQNWEVEIAYLNSGIEKVSLELREAETPGKASSRPIADIKEDLAKRSSRRDAALHELANYPLRPIVWGMPLTPVLVILGLVAICGANWFLLGLFCSLFPGAVRNVLHPFADGFSRRAGFGLAVLGLIMSLGGLVVVAQMFWVQPSFPVDRVVPRAACRPAAFAV